MNELQIFNFQNAPVRTVIVDGQPWWVAKDVCEILGLGNPRSSLSRLEEDEKGVHTMDTLGGNQEMAIVNEPGLYSLIIRSRKNEAKVFKRWVTHEVLPSIRKTGSYSVREPLNEIDRFAGMMNQFLPAVAGRITEITAAVVAQETRLVAVEQRQAEIDPQEIERRMHFLDQCKSLLVFGTKGKPQPVTFRSYWHTLKELIGINSFTNRAALTVPMMDKCVDYAREWCEARGVQPPALFDHLPSEQAAV